MLALRYDEPGISNLVSRLYGFTGETNVYLRVLSGEARISITNYLEEISHTNSDMLHNDLRSEIDTREFEMKNCLLFFAALVSLSAVSHTESEKFDTARYMVNVVN